VRMGAYGPFVQCGTRDDPDKPKFASLMPGQHMDDVTLPDALKLLSLPRALGHGPDGTPISVGRGQYGPYVKYGAKFASIKEDDPFEVTLERALEIVAAKQQSDRERTILDFPDAGIQVLKGRYGPYITDRKRNARIPKDRDPASVTLEECVALLAVAPERGKGRFGRRGAKKAALVATAAEAAAVAAAIPAAKAKGARKAPVKKKSAPRAAGDKARRAKE